MYKSTPLQTNPVWPITGWKVDNCAHHVILSFFQFLKLKSGAVLYKMLKNVIFTEMK